MGKPIDYAEAMFSHNGVCLVGQAFTGEDALERARQWALDMRNSGRVGREWGKVLNKDEWHAMIGDKHTCRIEAF